MCLSPLSSTSKEQFIERPAWFASSPCGKGGKPCDDSPIREEGEFSKELPVVETVRVKVVRLVKTNIY